MAHKLSTTSFNVLEILNDGKVHTGNDMAEALGVSRTAIWKIIQRLKKYDLPITSHHQGYHLKSSFSLIHKKRIQQFLEDKTIEIEVFENITSTNDYLKNKNSLKPMHVCLAEYQSQGRGRLGRTWFAPFGRNIYSSFSYTFPKDMSEMSGLSLVVGLLMIKALESTDHRLKPLLKWPNDIYLDHKKMGGILIDVMAEAHGHCAAIIGIGLNVNMKDIETATISQDWTSLEHSLDKKLDRNFIIARMIQSLRKGLAIFSEKGLEPFLEEWHRYDMLKGKTLTFIQGSSILSGIGEGVNHQGFLCLRLPDGSLKTFSSGDISLLKD